LRAIVGQLAPTSGRVVLGQTTRIAYFDQGRSDLDPNQSVFDNVVGDQPQIEFGGQAIEPYAYLERFGFGSKDYRQKVGSLSGGERARVALARLLRRSANLIILDEPTNDLDVASLGALEDLLVEFSVSTLCVTHDRWFLDRVASSILAFEGEGKVVRYAGNYQALAEQRQPAAKPQDDARRPSESEPRERKKKKGLTWAETRELEGLLDRIEQSEVEVTRLSETLAAPETYQRSAADIVALNAALDAAKANVEQLTSRWEELETKRTALDV
jgi:ATP-binding cassette subfamily F protein uup